MKSIFGTLIVSTALLTVGCTTSLPDAGESHSGMEWQEEVKRAGLKGNPLEVQLVEFGPVMGVGEYPSSIEWSDKGEGWSGERVEVVLTEQELAFLWWNPHLQELVVLSEYSFSFDEIDHITMESDPDLAPDGYSPSLEALDLAMRIYRLNPLPDSCFYQHFYIQAGDKVVEFSMNIDKKKAFEPIFDFLKSEAGAEVWEKSCLGVPVQRSTKGTPVKVVEA